MDTTTTATATDTTNKTSKKRTGGNKSNKKPSKKQTPVKAKLARAQDPISEAVARLQKIVDEGNKAQAAVTAGQKAMAAIAALRGNQVAPVVRKPKASDTIVPPPRQTTGGTVEHINVTTEEVYNAVSSLGANATTSRVAEFLNASKPVVLARIKTLKENGKVKQIGEKRGARYELQFPESDENGREVEPETTTN